MSFSISNIYSKIATAKTRTTLTAVLIFLLPFERIPSLDIFGVTIRASQLVGLGLIVVSVGPIMTFYKTKPHLPKLLLPTFLFSYFLSTLLATDFKRASMIFVFTVFVALVGSAIAATFTIDGLSRLEKYLYISTAIVLAVGFYQYLGDVFGLPPAVTGLRDIYTKEIFGFPRVQSTALEPLYYGSFLLIPYCILLSKRLQRSIKTPVYETLLMFAIVTQIALSVSRGAIIGVLVSSLVVGMLMAVKRFTSLKKLSLALLIVVVGFVAAYAMTFVSPKTKANDPDKYTSTKKAEALVSQATNLASQDDRARNRVIAIKAAKEYPILGIGPGNFNQYAIKEFPYYATVAPVIVNNEPLEILAEAGIIGFVLFVLFAAWTWLLVAMGYVKDMLKNKQALYWAPALLVYCIALVIQYQTFSTLYVMHVWVIIGLLMALAADKNSREV